MKIKEFTTTNWQKNVFVEYDGNVYKVVAVNFVEKLIAIDEQWNVDPIWVRYENAELVK